MTSEIIWFLTWPVLIWFSYKMVWIAVKKFEKTEENSQ